MNELEQNQSNHTKNTQYNVVQPFARSTFMGEAIIESFISPCIQHLLNIMIYVDINAEKFY